MCDYLETASSVSSTESFGASVESLATQFSVPDLSGTPEADATVNRWLRAGVCIMGDIRVLLRNPDYTYQKNDLLLLHHCLKAGQAPETSRYTVWTSKIPRFLAIASKHTFLMHAILSFAGAAFAFESQAPDAKSLAYHHGGIALRGLQHAITNFSKDNADAVLGASILLSWQANDWRSWASLITGIRTVVSSMRSWREVSMISDLITEQELSIPDSFPNPSQQPTDAAEYDSVIQHMYYSLDNLQQHYLYGREEELPWAEVLKDYLVRLRHVRPAQSAEEQFNNLYAFRKWVFWIPSICLQSERRDYLTLVLLSHLYASALQLEPLFADVAPAFCSLVVLQPLEEILKTFESLGSQAFHDQHVQDLLGLMDYPKRAIADYQARTLQLDFESMNPRRSSPPGLDRLNLDLAKYIETYGDAGHYSPAFMPSPVNRPDSSSLASEHSSPYLDMPGDRLSGAYSVSSLGSSYLPSGTYQDEALFRSADTPSGFVAQDLLWI